MPSHSTTTVTGYLIRRLTGAGVRSVFGARDCDPVLSRAIAGHPGLAWIETATEQAADNAAGAYARLRGLGVTLTATRPPRTMATSASVVHIVAATPRTPQLAGRFDLRPDNAAAEIDRILAAALRGQGPVCLGIPADVALAPVPVPTGPLPGASPDGEPLSWTSLWAAVQRFLAPCDVLVTDQDALDGASSLALPAGARLVAASSPVPAGWAGQAALGASLAAPDRRVVVVSGDHGPVWASGLGALLAQGLAPVMIWAGQDGTGVPGPTAAAGATAVATRVTSLPELTATLQAAGRRAAAGRLVLIEAVLGRLQIPARGRRAA